MAPVFEIAIQQIVNGLMVGTIYALMALGLMVVLGILNVVNMAQGELYMLGGYFAYTAVSILKVDYITSVLLAMIAAAVVGAFVERVSVRPLLGRPAAVFLATFGMSLMLKNIALLIWGPDPRDISAPFNTTPLVIGPVFLTQQRIFIFVAAVVVVLAFAAFLRWTRTGMALRALSRDKDAALLMGINANRLYMLSFGLGAGLAGGAGALLGAIFSVYPTMGELPLMKGFAVVVLAGIGSIAGVLVSALILGVTEGLAAAFVSTSWIDVVAFVVLILVLLIYPQGISRLIKRDA